MAIQTTPGRFMEQPPQPFGASAQWGLAALLIGGVLIVASCTTLIFNILFWQAGPAGIPMGLAYFGGIIGTMVVLALGIVGVVFGVRGWWLASSEGHCPALPVAGTLASAAGVVAWLIVAIDLIMILHTFDAGTRVPVQFGP
jgi:hypothetical protein